jgi:hypothetical protein
MQDDLPIVQPKSAQLNSNQWYRTIKETENVEKSTCDMFSDDNGPVSLSS